MSRPDSTFGSATGASVSRVSEKAVALGHPLVQSLMLDPTPWRLWPAVAVLRWMQRRSGLDPSADPLRLVYRSHPSLSFQSSEVRDIALLPDRIEVVLNAPGLASDGSPLPSSDIAAILADARRGGGMAVWLDSITDIFVHVLEEMLSRSHAAFSIATGGGVDAHLLASQLAGRTAALVADGDGALRPGLARDTAGATGFAGLFLGPPSVSGLQALFAAYTGLEVRIEEFSGVDLPISTPASIGQRIGGMIGRTCRVPSSGVVVHLDGGSDVLARRWAADRVRRRSLHLLALSYVGGTLPAVRIVLWLDPDNAPGAVLSAGAELGGLAILGRASQRVRLRLGL